MSEVKRWRIPKILYPCFAPVSETDEVVPAAAYDALKLARDTAEDRIVDLGNRLLKAEAERDSLRMAGVDPRYEAMRQRAEKAEHQIKVLRDLADIDTEARDNVIAERDKLAAECEGLEAENKRLAAKCQYIIDDRNKVVERHDKLAAMVERVKH